MRTSMATGPILAGWGVDGGSTRRMGLVLICDALGAGSLAGVWVGAGALTFGLATAGADLVAGFAAAASVGAIGVFSLAFAVPGAGAGLAAAANGFSTTAVGGDWGTGFKDGTADAGATEVGVATTVSSLRKLSLSFGLSWVSSAAGDAWLAGTAGKGSGAGATGAEAAEVGAAGASSLRKLSLSFGLSWVSSVTGDAWLAGTAGLSSVALAASTSPSTCSGP